MKNELISKFYFKNVHPKLLEYILMSVLIQKKSSVIHCFLYYIIIIYMP